MKTVEEVAKKLVGDDIVDSTRYLQMETARARALRAYPIVAVVGSSVRVTTTHAGYKDVLKPAGFKYNGLGEWTRKCSSSNEMLDVIRRIDAAIPDLLIQPGQEAILEKL